jgi:hypothetical protein
MGQFFEMKNLGTAELVETDCSWHDASCQQMRTA